MDTNIRVSSTQCGICALLFGSGLLFSITCLDFSKCTSLWVGLYAVKIRAEAMQEASEAVPSGMLSVVGQPQSKFTFACLEAQEHCTTLGIENPVCEVSSYLFPDCRVISGHLEVGVHGSNLPRRPSSPEGWNYSTPGSAQSVTGALPSPGPWEASGGQGCVWWSERCRERQEAGVLSPLHHVQTLGKFPAHVESKGAGPDDLQGLPVIRSGLLTAYDPVASLERQAVSCWVTLPCSTFS